MAEQGQQQGVNMRQAVDIAFGALRDLYQPAELEDVLLEEVLLSRTDLGTPNEWEVTIGFTRPYNSTKPGAVSNVFPQAKPRAYKRILLNVDDGEVVGMLDGRIDAD